MIVEVCPAGAFQDGSAIQGVGFKLSGLLLEAAMRVTLTGITCQYSAAIDRLQRERERERWAGDKEHLEEERTVATYGRIYELCLT